jgi:hypothetical protein
LQHIPRGVATIIVQNKSEVVLLSENNNYTYFCKIITTPIKSNEKHISKAWNRSIDGKLPKVGDHLEFQLDETNQYLMFSLIAPHQQWH